MNTMKGSSCISNGVKTAIGISFGSGFEEDHSQTFGQLQHKINVAWRQQPSGAWWTVSDPSLGSYEHKERVQLHLSNGVKTAMALVLAQVLRKIIARPLANNCSIKSMWHGDNSNQEPVGLGLCLIPHWAHIKTMKGSSCISNGLKKAICIGFGSGF
jgi:hypothetical protein